MIKAWGGVPVSSLRSLSLSLSLPNFLDNFLFLRIILEFALAIPNLFSIDRLNLAIELLTTNFHPVSKKFEPLTTAFA